MPALPTPSGASFSLLRRLALLRCHLSSTMATSAGTYTSQQYRNVQYLTRRNSAELPPSRDIRAIRNREIHPPEETSRRVPRQVRIFGITYVPFPSRPDGAWLGSDSAYIDADTTRAPRPGEQHGREYYYSTKEDFLDLVSRNGFVEHAQFGGNHYGTSVQAVKEIAEKGRICILDIEMEVRHP